MSLPSDPRRTLPGSRANRARPHTRRRVRARDRPAAAPPLTAMPHGAPGILAKRTTPCPQRAHAPGRNDPHTASECDQRLAQLATSGLSTHVRHHHIADVWLDERLRAMSKENP